MHRLNGQSVHQHEDMFPSDGIRSFHEPARPELWDRLNEDDGEFDFSALRTPPAGVILKGDADYIPELDLQIPDLFSDDTEGEERYLELFPESDDYREAA